jgi:hypothetical protein
MKANITTYRCSSTVLFGAYDWNAIPGGANEYCSWDAAGEPPVCAGHQYETGLIYLSHSNGVEVYPSIGGWTLSDNFPTLAANEASRKKFAENCVKLIQDYDFDGIDIDWEYPGYEDHSGTPDDTLNYSLFLKEIRIALDTLGKSTGRFYGLTAVRTMNVWRFPFSTHILYSTVLCCSSSGLALWSRFDR